MSIPTSCDYFVHIGSILMMVFVNIELIGLLIYILGIELYCRCFSLWPIVLNENDFEPNFKILPPHCSCTFISFN